MKNLPATPVPTGSGRVCLECLLSWTWLIIWMCDGFLQGATAFLLMCCTCVVALPAAAAAPTLLLDQMRLTICFVVTYHQCTGKKLHLAIASSAARSCAVLLHLNCLLTMNTGCMQ